MGSCRPAPDEVLALPTVIMRDAKSTWLHVRLVISTAAHAGHERNPNERRDCWRRVWRMGLRGSSTQDGNADLVMPIWLLTQEPLGERDEATVVRAAAEAASNRLAHLYNVCASCECGGKLNDARTKTRSAYHRSAEQSLISARWECLLSH